MTEAVKDARRALTCLYIAADEFVADDVNRKVEAAFVALDQDAAAHKRGAALLAETAASNLARAEAAEADAAHLRELRDNDSNLYNTLSERADELQAKLEERTRELEAMRGRKLTRVEVIDETGRVYTRRNLKKVLLSFQDDDDRTLKVFIDG